MNSIPRSEHPKPQFQRDSWMNLNGLWAFEIDNGRSGKARGLSAADAQLSGQILVPFCPQSELSGVNHKDFLSGVWYRRTFELTKEQLSGRVVLHFGAVDYHCEAFVNGVSVGTHTGGYVSFCFDVTEAVHEGENVITVYAEDDERDPLIPRGKQSELFYSHGCDYTRTTGIWQTVWMEFLPETHIEKIKIFPNVETGSFDVEALLKGAGTLAVEASYEGRPMGAASVKADGGLVRLHLPLQETHLWELGCGRLYDLKLTYGADTVQSYAGLRSVRLDGYRFLLNGKSVFQRTVLDQGFYPDGIYTAPTRSRRWRTTFIFPWPAASTAPACMKRFSRSASCITATVWAIWSGASSPTGAGRDPPRRGLQCTARMAGRSGAGFQPSGADRLVSL